MPYSKHEKNVSERKRKREKNIFKACLCFSLYSAPESRTLPRLHTGIDCKREAFVIGKPLLSSPTLLSIFTPVSLYALAISNMICLFLFYFDYSFFLSFSVSLSLKYIQCSLPFLPNVRLSYLPAPHEPHSSRFLRLTASTVPSPPLAPTQPTFRESRHSYPVLPT